MDPTEVLSGAYADLTEWCLGLDEARSWQPTACAGWAVRDLVFHLLGDAQRAVVALATPGPEPADRDAVGYWAHATQATDPDSRNLRATRTMASAWRLAGLTATYVETGRAVVTLARRTPADAVVATQGVTLTAHDLVRTLIVEATIHVLDLPVSADPPEPRPDALVLTRSTLDGLLGTPSPASWETRGWILAATGRRALTDAEQAALGTAAGRLPLIR